jgi:hypothetical protein
MTVELSRDGGVTWLALNPAVTNTGATYGSFGWTVTGPASAVNRVRVRPVGGPTGAGESPSFAVVAPPTP